ncbi:MAG: ATP-dependent sacrificial sulfur transferase LarE [Nitrospirales bacterium]
MDDRTVVNTDTLRRLRGVLQEMDSILVAFSGGIDSTVVFKVAHDTLGAKTLAVTAVSPTFPAVELEVARRVGAEIGGRHVIIDTDQLNLPEFVRNDAARCYHCKTDLYTALEQLRAQQGIKTIVDGTHLGDLGDDRPGIQAARAQGVHSPLVEAALTKEDVRALAKSLGLSNWDKPAAACLSSRIPRGVMITREKLSRVERAEAILGHEGFRQFRVRDQGDVARIEIEATELGRMLEGDRRERVTQGVKEAGFRFVTLDLEGYRTGSTNSP